jgi:branched-chain amino acid aminotransferase
MQRSKLVTQLTKNPKAKLPNKELVFGKTFTDHMLEIDWEVR